MANGWWKIAFGTEEMTISASIGLALFPGDGTTRDELCKAADLALYEAKRDGRNTWRWPVARNPQAAPAAPVPAQAPD